VIDAKDGWVEWVLRRTADEEVRLAAGMLLHVPPEEWHVFNYKEGGFVDIVFVYAPPI